MNENENAHGNSTANSNATGAAHAITHAFFDGLGSNSMSVACRTTPNAGNEIGEESIPSGPGPYTGGGQHLFYGRILYGLLESRDPGFYYPRWA
jgi:hypothetical protein